MSRENFSSGAPWEPIVGYSRDIMAVLPKVKPQPDGLGDAEGVEGGQEAEGM